MQGWSAAGTLFFVFLVLICTGFPSLSFGADAGFKVFWVETDKIPGKNNNSEPIKDFYINGGENHGITESMILDVYRKKVVRDTNGAEYEIGVLVGRVKVFRLFQNVAITRIISLTSSDASPVLQYRTVMHGDYAVPAGNYTAFKKKEIKDDTGSNIMIPAASVSSIMFPLNVLFEIGDWKLKPEAMETLSVVYDMFTRSKNKDIVIEGHSCILGTNEYNLELSKKRAESVFYYLINIKNIPREHIRIEYYGEKFPVAPTNTEEGRVKSRRVNIRFQPR
jgi:outer membrane protein OmpA-like peptidoglycan-associated protein